MKKGLSLTLEEGAALESHGYTFVENVSLKTIKITPPKGSKEIFPLYKLLGDTLIARSEADTNRKTPPVANNNSSTNKKENDLQLRMRALEIIQHGGYLPWELKQALLRGVSSETIYYNGEESAEVQWTIKIPLRDE